MRKVYFCDSLVNTSRPGVSPDIHRHFTRGSFRAGVAESLSEGDDRLSAADRHGEIEREIQTIKYAGGRGHFIQEWIKMNLRGCKPRVQVAATCHTKFDSQVIESWRLFLRFAMPNRWSGFMALTTVEERKLLPTYSLNIVWYWVSHHHQERAANSKLNWLQMSTGWCCDTNWFFNSCNLFAWS